MVQVVVLTATPALQPCLAAVSTASAVQQTTTASPRPAVKVHLGTVQLHLQEPQVQMRLAGSLGLE